MTYEIGNSKCNMIQINATKFNLLIVCILWKRYQKLHGLDWKLVALIWNSLNKKLLVQCKYTLPIRYDKVFLKSLKIFIIPGLVSNLSIFKIFLCYRNKQWLGVPYI